MERITAHAKRIVRVGDYESYSLGIDAEASPDETLKASENMEMLLALAQAKVDEAAQTLIDDIKAAKGES